MIRCHHIKLSSDLVISRVCSESLLSAVESSSRDISSPEISRSVMLVSSDSLSPGSEEEPGATAWDSRKNDMQKSELRGVHIRHYLTIVGKPTGSLGSSCSSVDASSVSWTVSEDQDLATLVTVKPTI